MLAIINSATVDGVEGHPVRVEVHLSNGLPSFTIVGQPDGSCREARDRVRAALLSSGYSWPLKRVTVNLAPTAVRKVGAGFDLPIALGLLVLEGQVDAGALDDCAFIGELGLDGSLRRVPGILSMVDRAIGAAVVVPMAAGPEAALTAKAVRSASTLKSLVEHLQGRSPWPRVRPAPAEEEPPGPDMADVKGQLLGRRAAVVAAAGGHHLLMVGAQGAGKTILAERVPGLLPDLSRAEAIEATRIWSVAGMLPERAHLVRRPPLRAPHHSSSIAALVGGGSSRLRPGEISLAHNGVLFLDEMSEFPRSVLDTLRQPLEQGFVTVSRAGATWRFPSRFQLVGATNPCRCGLAVYGQGCQCPAGSRQRYAQRLSGPLLDRFDLRIVIPRTDPAALMGAESGEPTAVLAREVARVRALSGQRGLRTNADIPASRLDEVAPLTPAARDMLRRRLEAGRLNPRGVHRARRVARTIADLAGEELIADEHLAEALALRTEEERLRAVAA